MTLPYNGIYNLYISTYKVVHYIMYRSLCRTRLVIGGDVPNMATEYVFYGIRVKRAKVSPDGK